MRREEMFLLQLPHLKWRLGRDYSLLYLFSWCRRELGDTELFAYYSLCNHIT